MISDPILRWWNEKRQDFVSDNVVAGTSLRMQETAYSVRPTRFVVSTRYEGFLRQLFQRHGIQEPVGTPFGVPPGDDPAWSDGAYEAPMPHRRHGQMELIFHDDARHPSAPMHSVHWARVYPRDTATETSFELMPHGLPKIFVRREKKENRLPFEGYAPRDPKVSITVLTPWDDGDRSLRDYLHDYLGQIEKGVNWSGGKSLEDTFEEEYGAWFPSDRPSGWEIYPDRQELMIEPDTATPIDLIVHAPSGSSAILALELKSNDSDLGDESAVSDLFLISNVADTTP
jgi:hypothetical protein